MVIFENCDAGVDRWMFVLVLVVLVDESWCEGYREKGGRKGERREYLRTRGRCAQSWIVTITPLC